MKNKPLDSGNDLDLKNEEDWERISVSDFSIEEDGERVSVSTCKSDKEVKGVRWGSRKARVGWL